MYRPPIIIIGMHRSGTTMVAAMLRQLGLFIGNDLEDNSESIFFINHNDWLLSQSGGAWDNPASIRWFFQNEQLVELAEEYIRDRVNGLPVFSYLGWTRVLMKQRPLTGMGQPWGWKDPRTTFTLPLWLRLFPDARVIHIYRNGVPVAASLRARERELLKKAESNHKKRKASGIYNLIAKKAGFVWSSRCLSLEGGYSLWEEYVETAIQMTNEVAPHAFTLKYEDFLKNPVECLIELSDYCGLTPPENEVEKVASVARPGRANAFMNDEELKAFYLTVKSRPLMEQLGYGMD